MTSGFEFATSYLSIGVVAALAVTVIAALARTLVLHARLARRTRELERELEQRHRAEAELEGIRDGLEQRVRERTQALEVAQRRTQPAAAGAGNRQSATQTTGRPSTASPASPTAVTSTACSIANCAAPAVNNCRCR